MRAITPRRPVDLAAEAVRDAILDGEWAPGERLPPERELAETLGISRLTLRAATSRLTAQGLLQPKQGSGVRVLDWRSTAGIGLLPTLFARGELTLLAPFLELRRAVAIEIAATACTRATATDLDQLQSHADALAVEQDLERLAEGNLAFARAVLRLADNLPAELLFNTVADVYRARPELRQTLLARPDAVRASFPIIVALLRTRDPDHVRSVVRVTLEAVDAATLETL
ncbi:MAG: GntR family transcriptional repressor for pyruvate dehydrogenase complex [Myxococcota bacterium]